jgi:hypothetical protein
MLLAEYITNRCSSETSYTLSGGSVNVILQRISEEGIEVRVIDTSEMQARG